MNAQIATVLTAAVELPPSANDVFERPTAVARPAPPRRRLGIAAPDPLGWLLGPALLVLFWTIGSMSGFIDPRVLPAPWATVTTAADLLHQGRLQANLLISAWRAAQGLFFGVTAGVAVALIAGLSLSGGYVFDGLVQVKRAIPTLALIPLVILWFGIGETMKVTVIAISVFIPIYLNTHTALRGIETRYVELAETLDLSRWAFIRQVVLPGALPGFLLGLRFAVMAAWLALVVVEQLNATSGIGYMINLARTYAQSDVIVVGLVVYALLGLGSDLAVRTLEARTLTWRRTFAK
jgi:sulfonate transport system permease protein|nr:sulfonate transport system permease protein [Phenylobacterium sp.]